MRSPRGILCSSSNFSPVSQQCGTRAYRVQFPRYSDVQQHQLQELRRHVSVQRRNHDVSPGPCTRLSAPRVTDMKENIVTRVACIRQCHPTMAYWRRNHVSNSVLGAIHTKVQCRNDSSESTICACVMVLTNTSAAQHMAVLIKGYPRHNSCVKCWFSTSLCGTMLYGIGMILRSTHNNPAVRVFHIT